MISKISVDSVLVNVVRSSSHDYVFGKPCMNAGLFYKKEWIFRSIPNYKLAL